MPGMSSLTATLQILASPGLQSGWSGSHVMAQSEWTGPLTVEIPTGTAEQILVLFWVGGLTTVSAVIIASDQNVSITYGETGSNEPILLSAGGIHAFSGTSLESIAVSNTSGVAATLTVLAAGP